MAALHYTKSHEYIKEEEGAYFLGISNHAQKELGDITYVELPASGSEFSEGEVCCTVESVKAVAEVYAPLKLAVVKPNERLNDHPELINEDAEGEGWLIEVTLADASALGALMDAQAYAAMEK